MYCRRSSDELDTFRRREGSMSGDEASEKEERLGAGITAGKSKLSRFSHGFTWQRFPGGALHHRETNCNTMQAKHLVCDKSNFW